MLSFSFNTLEKLRDALDWEDDLFFELESIYLDMCRNNDKRANTLRQVLEIFDDIKNTQEV